MISYYRLVTFQRELGKKVEEYKPYILRGRSIAQYLLDKTGSQLYQSFIKNADDLI